MQQLSFDRDGERVTFTYFDTEPQGKFALGPVYWPGGAPPAGAPGVVSHLAPVIRESETVSAYWQKLGFPAFRMSMQPHARIQPTAATRSGSRLRWVTKLDQFSYEWIIPPMTPPNIYADFLKKHSEGIQRLGMPVDDLGKAVADYEKLGYHVWQSGAWGDVGKKDSGQYDYMDTDSIGGVVVELIHAYK